MKTFELRDAKANLSALVRAAERGKSSVITKHGRPVAALVPVEAAERFHPTQRPSLAEYLLAAPARLEHERDQTPLRAAEF
jgi:prevent-host-death family protein